MRLVASLVVSAGVELAVLAPVTPAAAQSPSDTALAETLFRDGRELMAAGKTDEGCPKLEASQRMDPKIGTLTNLALCHELQGKTASAWAEFTQAAALATTLKRATVEQFTREHATALEAKLSRLTIEVSQPAGEVQVAIDGKPIASAAIGVAIPLDPGSHAIEARTRSGDSWSQTVVIEPGPRSQEIKVPHLAAPSATASEAPEGLPAPPSGDADRTAIEPGVPSRSDSVRRFAGFAAIGLGGASLAAGSYFGLRTFSKKGDGNALCQGAACTQQGYDLQQQASSAATAATIFFAAGVVLTGAGVFLVLVHPSPGHPAVRAVPLVEPHVAAITVKSEW